jgi:hypothetical protein
MERTTESFSAPTICGWEIRTPLVHLVFDNKPRGERWVSNEKKSFVQYTNAGLQKILSPQCQAYVTRIR